MTQIQSWLLHMFSPLSIIAAGSEATVLLRTPSPEE
jgi:hypothetical protein